jgi:hypothetical protein
MSPGKPCKHDGVEDEPPPSGFDYEWLGLSILAECRMCGKEFILEPEYLADAECCEALERLKRWSVEQQ